MWRFLLCLLVVPAWAFAACDTPPGEAGHIIFNTTTKTMQYCNGNHWVNTGASEPAAAQSGCISPTAITGTVHYASNTGVIQFCNGENWIDTACAARRKPNGSGCGGKAPGTMQYNSTHNELQFCDSTDWVAMGWGCSHDQSAPVWNSPTTYTTTLIVNTAYNMTPLVADDQGIASYSIQGAKPVWLNLNASTGEVSGNPTPVGTYTYTIRATDTSANYVERTFTVVANPVPDTTPPVWNNPTTYTSSLIVNTAYTMTPTVTDNEGVTGYTIQGTKPSWLNLNASTGQVTGTPTAVGTYTYTIRASDAAGNYVERTFTVTVNPVPDTTPPVWNSPTTYTATVVANTAYSMTPSVTDNKAVTGYTIQGTKPSWLNLNASNGQVTGTPTTDGTYTYTIRASDAAGNYVERTFTITVTPDVVVATIASNANNVNVQSLFSAADWASTTKTKRVIINSGVTVGSTSVATAALLTGTGRGSNLVIQNSGTIAGAGGAANGGAGGPAINSQQTGVTITNAGNIYGGGGGGGRGGNGGAGAIISSVRSPTSGEYYEFANTAWHNTTGNFMNGPGAYVYYAASLLGTGPYNSTSFTTGNRTYYRGTYKTYTTDYGYSTYYYAFYYTTNSNTPTTGGAGGNGGRGRGSDGANAAGTAGAAGGTNAGTGGTGGAGGGYGAAGATGGTGTAGNAGAGAAGSAGGAAGRAVIGSGYTVTNTGSILGAY